MTRHQLAVLVSSVFSAFSPEEQVHEVAYSRKIINPTTHELLSLRRLERLPKMSLCQILGEFVDVAKESCVPNISEYAQKVEDALFSVDAPFLGGYDSLLNSSSTPLPVMGLLSSLIALNNPRDPITAKWLDLQYKWCELDIDGYYNDVPPAPTNSYEVKLKQQLQDDLKKSLGGVANYTFADIGRKKED